MENKEILPENGEAEVTVEAANPNLIKAPAIALRGKTLFPNVFTSVDIGRLKSLNAVKAALSGDKLVIAVTQKTPDVDMPEAKDLYTVGTVIKLGTLGKVGGENFRITAEGLFRVKIVAEISSDDYFYFDAEKLAETDDSDAETQGAFRYAKQLFKDNFAGVFKNNREAFLNISNLDSVNEFINVAAFNLPFKETDKQTLLELTDTKARITKFCELLSVETEIAKAEKNIAERVKESVEKSQKEFYLREQIKAIHQELGDDERETDRLEQEIKEKGLPKDSEEKVLKELFRMGKMQPSSPDYTVLRTYIDWVLDLPFKTESTDTESLTECKKILEEDHFGLDKVKERIVEYLAVLKLTKSLKGPILCLVGPPGVGKTSIAKSVARALNRKLVRMSLGGVKDEAEIRGHRKTYIGAMPGRIIYGMKEAGTINPVFLLDEIDKLSSDLRGDPASALLEVLDPEQNSTFRDRYLEIPYDLSKVMFITTANSKDTIPAPLLDRMEVIDIAGYTEEEKIQIALRYLVPKQIAANGLTDMDLEFSEEGVRAIIKGYTGEAGVRKLEQEIGAVARKVATRVAENGRGEKVTVTDKNVEEYLGAFKFVNNGAVEKDQIGSATGLAWTAIGGVTLTIEVATMRGKGELALTGKLGDVMKESAKTAISFIRANAQNYGIDSTIFENTDIHVHVPEGATPKDGPSAGITMATAILSALTGKKVRRNIAMTGEVTLRGNVLPIGGLKEKALAAYRLGIKKVIIPKANVKDLEEIPKEIADKIKFIPVENVNEVFKTAVRDL